ncbi:MAG: MFS transporter [Planctomycetota bacterium]|jgi:MFS family permease
MSTTSDDPMNFPPRTREPTALAVAILVAWMWVAYFLNYCDRQAVFAMFSVLKKELSMTDGQLGLTGTFFLWVYGIGCPIAGILADRVSKRRLILASLIVWSLVTIATGLSASAGMLLTMRAAMGISEALFMPAAIAWTTAGTPAKWRSRAVAGLTTAQVAGVVGGSSFGGWMADRGQWRMAFVVLGIVGLIYAIPYAWYLAKSSRPTAQENVPPMQSHRKDSVSGLRAIGGLFRVPTFCMLCMIFPLFVFGLWMILSWLASYMQEKFELTLSQAGLASTLYLQASTLVGLFFGGYVADRWRARYRSGRMMVLLVSLVLCAPLLWGIGRADNLEMLKVLLVGYGFFSGWMMGNVFPAAFDVVPASSRGSVVGILNLFGALLSGFAPLAVGTWKESIGFPGMLSVAAVAYAVAAVLLLFTLFTCFGKDWEHYGATNPAG